MPPNVGSSCASTTECLSSNGLTDILLFHVGSTNDLCCVASCHHVPCPNQSQANNSNECVAKCPQGSGTPADATRYAQCEQGCFSTHYFPITGTGAATGVATGTSAPSTAEATATGSGAAGTSGSYTASGMWQCLLCILSGQSSRKSNHTNGRATIIGSDSSSTGSSSSGSGSGTSTASSASSSSSDNAAGRVQLGASAAGILGLFLAAVAL